MKITLQQPKVYVRRAYEISERLRFLLEQIKKNKPN